MCCCYECFDAILDWLEDRGRGKQIGGRIIPIFDSAFDLRKRLWRRELRNLFSYVFFETQLLDALKLDVALDVSVARNAKRSQRGDIGDPELCDVLEDFFAQCAGFCR